MLLCGRMGILEGVRELCSRLGSPVGDKVSGGGYCEILAAGGLSKRLVHCRRLENTARAGGLCGSLGGSARHC